MSPLDATAPGASDARLGEIVREEVARIVGTILRSFGDLDLAEEAVAQAVEEALVRWRVDGVPPNPAGWLTTAARHNAIDLLRRARRHRDRVALLDPRPAEAPETTAEVDERVPLLFGCCHPALSAPAQLALTLRAVVGLTTAQIARATLEAPATVAQRIVRAKRKITASGIPLRIPPAEARRERLDLVLTVVSVMYDAAHLGAEAGAEADRDLAEDAVWLARVLVAALPEEAEARGLLALLLFHRSREPARGAGGRLVPLPEQDRARWDRTLVAAAQRELEGAAALRAPGRWQLHAAIAACHSDAATADETDWEQVLVLYGLLLRHDRSPIVRLNRAVALAEVAGPAEALAELDRIRPALDGHHRWHAVRAELLRCTGRSEESLASARRALQLADNAAEQALLAERAATEQALPVRVAQTAPSDRK